MALKCKAAITHGDGRLIIDEIQVADPGADEVLIQVKASGICHTDYDSLRWGKELIPGHEGAGIILKKGKEVSHLEEGDRVALNWAIPCGKCTQCSRGNFHLCRNNSPVVAGKNGFSKGHAHAEGTAYHGRPIFRSFCLGTLSEYTLVKSAAVVRMPAAVSFPAAAISGCAVMTGFGSVMNIAQVTEGSSVAIIGAGNVGLNVIQTARIARAFPIIAIDVNEERLKFAQKFGATHTVLSQHDDKNLLQAAQQVRSILNGEEGTDFAFECSAIPELGAAPLALIRNGGMALQLSGIEQEITIDMNLFEWDKKYINPLYGGCRPQIDFARLAEHYLNKELLIDELITRTYALDELPQAFEDLISGKNGKGVIQF